MNSALDSKTYTVTLRDRRTVADSTMAFSFDKPAGFVFSPSQFVDLTLPHWPIRAGSDQQSVVDCEGAA